MKINKQNTKKTKTIIFAILIILLISTGLILWWVNSNSQKNTEKKEENTSKVEEKKEDQKKSEETKKQEAVKEIIDSKTKSSGYTNFPTYTTVQVEDGIVRVAGQISGLLYDDGNGKCSYILTHSSGTKIELLTEILESPGNKYCKAITKKINDSNLKPGKWTAITTYINSKQKQEGRSDGQSFTIEK